jgi:hypothetical protein
MDSAALTVLVASKITLPQTYAAIADANVKNVLRKYGEPVSDTRSGFSAEAEPWRSRNQ